ncbi:MAG: PEP-CTERM sorting domain-containing protein [Terriglobia bacterium]
MLPVASPVIFSDPVFMADGENWSVLVCNGTSSDSSLCAASDPAILLTTRSNPAPEPSSLPLLGVALLGSVAMLRRANLLPA